MKFSTLVYPFLTFTLLSFCTKADTYQSSCDECVQDYQFKNAAEAFVSGKTYPKFDSDVYIFNYKGGIVKKYSITTEYLDIPGEPLLLFSTEQDLTSSQYSNFIKASETYNKLTESIQDSMVPESIADSAYDLVGASYIENDISDYLAQNQTFKDNISVFISVAAKVSGSLPSDIKIIFQMTFKDGSWASFELTGLDKDGNSTLSFISGRDKDNNSITNDPDMYNRGSFRFTQGGDSAINNFLSAARRLGIIITYGSEGSSSETKLVCSGSAADGDLICTVILAK
jgi:hypothetical protein